MGLEILKLEQEIIAATLSSDVEVLDQLLHDQLIFVNHLGMTLSKEQDLNPHITGDLKITGLVASDHQVRVFGDTCVVVVTKDIRGSYLSQAFESKLRFTRIWKSFNGEWKVIAVSSVPHPGR